MSNKYSAKKGMKGKVRLSINVGNLVSMAKSKPNKLKKLKFYKLGTLPISDTQFNQVNQYNQLGSTNRNPWIQSVGLPERANNIGYTLKQRIKYFYALTDKELSLLVSKVQGSGSKLDLSKSNARVNLLSLIESRADVLLCRAHLAVSIFEARDLIKKGVVSINNKLIRFPNEIVPLGGELSLHPAHAIKSQLRILTCHYFRQRNPNYLLFKNFYSVILCAIPSPHLIPLPLTIPVSKLSLY